MTELTQRDINLLKLILTSLTNKSHDGIVDLPNGTYVTHKEITELLHKLDPDTKRESKIAAIKKLVGNRLKHDKASIGYLIGMMDTHNAKYPYYHDYTRPSLIAEFERLI